MTSRLSVSNIAWNPDEDGAVLPLLRELGVTGVEMAPTKLFPDWQGVSPAAAADARRRYADEGFAIPALQAILFGRPDLKVFGDAAVQQQTLDHLAIVADIAAALGAKVLVFGAPGNRDRGGLEEEEAFKRAVPFFQAAGQICAERGVALGIEANPAAYKCTFMTRWTDALRLVETVASPGIRLHFDVACTALAGDDPIAALPVIAPIAAHFHISEPELADFAAPTIDHAAVGTALAAQPYDGWLSIEMRRSADPLASVRTAVERVKQWYPSIREAVAC